MISTHSLNVVSVLNGALRKLFIIKYRAALIQITMHGFLTPSDVKLK